MYLSESRNFQNCFRRRQTAGSRAEVATGLFGNEFRCIFGARPSSSQASDTQPIDMQTVLLVEDDLRAIDSFASMLRMIDRVSRGGA
jgi:hypothetical protein